MSRPRVRTRTLPSDTLPDSTPKAVAELVDTASGRAHRHDPISRRSGGPAGNARWTAWTGIALLALIAVEMFTVLDIHGLLSWHIVVGTILVPVALLKTATTGWRILRYYTGHGSYRQAGPPPTLLRALGPLVVVSTLAVLGTGLALIALGPDASRRPYVTVLGQSIDMVTLHKATFLAFVVFTGLHILARVVPAVVLATGKFAEPDAERPHVPGGVSRGVLLVLSLVAGIVTAVLVLSASNAWQHAQFGDHHEGLRSSIPRGM